MNTDILSIVHKYQNKINKTKQFFVNKYFYNYLKNDKYIRNMALGFNNYSYGNIKTNYENYVVRAGRTNNKVFLKYLISCSYEMAHEFSTKGIKMLPDDKIVKHNYDKDLYTYRNRDNYSYRLIGLCFIASCEKNSSNIMQYIIHDTAFVHRSGHFTLGYFLVKYYHHTEQSNLFNDIFNHDSSYGIDNYINWNLFAFHALLTNRSDLYELASHAVDNTYYLCVAIENKCNKIVEFILSSNLVKNIYDCYRHYNNNVPTKMDANKILKDLKSGKFGKITKSHHSQLFAIINNNNSNKTCDIFPLCDDVKIPCEPYLNPNLFKIEL